MLISPRLPSSGNRILRDMYCLIWFFVQIIRGYYVNNGKEIVTYEGGGFIDAPGIKFYSIQKEV